MFASGLIDVQREGDVWTLRARRWAHLDCLIKLNLLILASVYLSSELELRLFADYALSSHGRERIDWRCQKNFKNYQVITENFKIGNKIVSQLGFDPKLVIFQTKKFRWRFSNETKKYPIIFVSQNFSFRVRTYNLIRLWIASLYWGIGIKVRVHPKNRFTVLESIFCILPRLKFDKSNSFEESLESGLFVVGAYSNGLLIASMIGLKTFSCPSLDKSFPDTYKDNLKENDIKVTTLYNTMKEISDNFCL